jgi:hypothetical protein
MSKPEHQPADLLARAAYLESQLGLLRPVAGLAMILVVAALVAFVRAGPSVVQAQRLELVDMKGKVHAALAADTTGTVVTLFDQDGRVSASLQLNDDPRLALRDAAGREVAGLGAPRVQHLAQ